MTITIHRDGQNYGPYTLEELRQHLASGGFTLTDLAFVEGSTNWISLSSVPGIIHPISIPPPPIALLVKTPHKRGILKSCLMIVGILFFGWIALLFVLSIAVAISRNTPNNSTVSASQNLSTSSNSTVNDPPKISNIPWDEISSIYSLKSTATDIQKDEYWKKYKGKYVKWTGSVSEISKSMGTYTLQVKMNPDTFVSDLIIYLNDSEKDKALTLSVGQSVTFVGQMDEWGTLMPITLRNGVLQ